MSVAGGLACGRCGAAMLAGSRSRCVDRRVCAPRRPSSRPARSRQQRARRSSSSYQPVHRRGRSDGNRHLPGSGGPGAGGRRPAVRRVVDYAVSHRLPGPATLRLDAVRGIMLGRVIVGGRPGVTGRGKLAADGCGGGARARTCWCRPTTTLLAATLRRPGRLAVGARLGAGQVARAAALTEPIGAGADRAWPAPRLTGATPW